MVNKRFTAKCVYYSLAVKSLYIPIVVLLLLHCCCCYCYYCLRLYMRDVYFHRILRQGYGTKNKNQQNENYIMPCFLYVYSYLCKRNRSPPGLITSRPTRLVEQENWPWCGPYLLWHCTYATLTVNANDVKWKWNWQIAQ